MSEQAHHITERTSPQVISELEDFFPNVGQFAETQEEYIRTLEKALQLLQREVEHLRQRRPEIAVQPVTSAKEDVTHLFQHATTAEEVMSALRGHLASNFPPHTEAMLYYRTPQHLLTPASADSTPNTDRAVTHFDEQGVIDWMFGDGAVKIVPDMSNPAGNSRVLLAPLFLRGAPAGVFVATFDNAVELSEYDMAGGIRFAESALVALDNIRSAAEIGQMNHKLALLNRQMLQSSKLASIGELAGSVSHEINSPLQILLAHLQLLESGVGNPAHRLEIIKQQVRRIGEITRRLLDFARSTPTEAGIEEVDTRQIIDEVLLFVNSQLNRDGIQVVCEIDDPPPIVSGSKAHLEQVLLNLVLNARDAMPDGGTITIGAFMIPAGKALITIADTGTGISEEHLPHIFDPFYTTKRRGKGTGLGLSITKTIIEQHRGAIDVVSQYGKGTTFKISLPLSKAAR